MKVHDVMSIQDALELMRREHVLRLAVVNGDGALQGILSMNDFPEKDYSLPAPSNEAPHAFDEKGYSPIERVFNEA